MNRKTRLNGKHFRASDGLTSPIRTEIGPTSSMKVRQNQQHCKAISQNPAKVP